jgi:hypothetical protein
LRLRWMFGLIFVLVLALALGACGGGDEEEDENGDGGGTPAATKTVAADETEEPEKTVKPEKTEEPSSGGGGASLENIPVYPGADKVGGDSGDYSLPSLAGDIGDEDYTDVEWAVYETGDSVGDVGDFYKDKMPDNGWEDEGWYDLTIGVDAAWGSFTRDDGDSAAWIVVTRNEDDDKTEIVIGAGSK